MRPDKFYVTRLLKMNCIDHDEDFHPPAGPPKKQWRAIDWTGHLEAGGILALQFNLAQTWVDG
jgi:hypothetical protein